MNKDIINMFVTDDSGVMVGSKWYLRKSPDFVVTVCQVIGSNISFTNNQDLFVDTIPACLFLIRFYEVGNE